VPTPPVTDELPLIFPVQHDTPPPLPPTHPDPVR
jgi:hypothetical protein